MPVEWPVYLGPSVYEAAEALIRKNKRLIEDLQHETHRARNRLVDPSFKNMLEAERIASNTESFQTTQLEQMS